MLCSCKIKDTRSRYVELSAQDYMLLGYFYLKLVDLDLDLLKWSNGLDLDIRFY